MSRYDNYPERMLGALQEYWHLTQEKPNAGWNRVYRKYSIGTIPVEILNNIKVLSKEPDMDDALLIIEMVREYHRNVNAGRPRQMNKPKPLVITERSDLSSYTIKELVDELYRRDIKIIDNKIYCPY